MRWDGIGQDGMGWNKTILPVAMVFWRFSGKREGQCNILQPTGSCITVQKSEDECYASDFKIRSIFGKRIISSI